MRLMHSLWYDCFTPLGLLKLCTISVVYMRTWPGGFPRHMRGCLSAVWEVPGLAGVMRCNERTRKQQSRASGAVHLLTCCRFLWSDEVLGRS